MGSNQWLLLLIVVWLGSGLAVAWWAGRSGHDLRLWIPLGILLGPILALIAQERDQMDRRPEPSRTPVEKPGSLDVLVGVDGSAESVAAAREAIGILEPVMSTLTLATVLNYEEKGPFTGMSQQSDAYGELVDIALDLGYEPTEIELLYGDPAEALIDWAVRSESELIVVGARGRGLADKILGSVASELVGVSPLPVLVGPRKLDAGSRPSTDDSLTGLPHSSD